MFSVCVKDVVFSVCIITRGAVCAPEPVSWLP